MAINLQKGQRQDIASQKFTVGLGWDENSSVSGADFDLDASVFILNDKETLISDSHFIFYNNLKSPDEAVIHTGDNLTGDGDGDDEQIKIDLSKIDAQASQIIVLVTIHDYEARHQNFGQVRNAFVRIVDDTSGTELMKFELDEDYSIETSVVFGRIYKRGADWKFEAVGTGMNAGLDHYVGKYT